MDDFRRLPMSAIRGELSIDAGVDSPAESSWLSLEANNSGLVVLGPAVLLVAEVVFGWLWIGSETTGSSFARPISGDVLRDDLPDS